METIQELLSTSAGTEGSLLIVKKIYDKLLEERDKNLFPRTEAAIYISPAEIPGSSVDVDMDTPDTLAISLTAEGDDFTIDEAAQTSVNIKPVKYGVGIRVTREMMEDAKWNMLERNIKIAGKRFAENETKLIITELDNATNTVTAGTAGTKLGLTTITSAMRYLDDEDFEGTSFAVGNKILQDLRDLEAFYDASKNGNREMLDKGIVGTIYGLNVFRFSTKAAPSVDYAEYAYIFDNTEAYAIAEKRVLTIEKFKDEAADLEAASLSQRIAVKILKPKSVVKVTAVSA